jgi:hypothetical protein
MSFIINNAAHSEGDHRCAECYRGYPMKCACGKGLIHAQFIKETWDLQIQLAFLCDACGNKYQFPEYRAGKKKRGKSNPK